MAGVAGCDRSNAPSTVHEAPGASFREGHGVKIPEAMQKSLGIRILDVTEQKLAAQVEIPLHVLRDAAVADSPNQTEASGWISKTQAAAIKPGQTGRIILADGKTASGIVARIDKAADAALGDFEIVVHTIADLRAGTTVTAVFESAVAGEVVAVPAAAVMRTAEGEFVYAVNEEHFKRVPVQTGGRNTDSVEITDGLYAGDQIVANQVVPLWMTELQTLRAGKSCCEGH
jgi:hypothetical protein